MNRALPGVNFSSFESAMASHYGLPIEIPASRYGAGTMNTRSLKIAGMTAGLAAAPMLSVAANSPVAMDSCAKASH
jgi:hypothetical protein